MVAYIIRRLSMGVVMLLAMALVVFMLFFSVGDPARDACGRNCTAAKVDQIRHVLGYDKPAIDQYGLFLKGLVAGRDYPVDAAYRAKLEVSNPEFVTHCSAPCLGFSNVQQATVSSVIWAAAPVTISLAIVAFIFWIVIGVSLGIYAAVKKGKAADKILVGSTLVLYALPTFFVGGFLLKFMAIKWHIFPYPQYTPFTQNPWQWFTGLLLPAITLAVFFMAAYVRMTRAFMLETLTEDYIRTAEAKGASRTRILVKHALRATLTPLVTMAGLDFAVLLGGAIITERVFLFPGLGNLAVQANHDQDLPVLIGLVLIAGAAVIIMNILVDIVYAFIDPRVRLD